MLLWKSLNFVFKASRKAKIQNFPTAPTSVAPTRNTLIHYFLAPPYFQICRIHWQISKTLKYHANKLPPPPNISPCNFNVHFLLPKTNRNRNQHREATKTSYWCVFAPIKSPFLKKKPTKMALWKILSYGPIFGILRYIQKSSFKL